jgi:hypothetical protein
VKNRDQSLLAVIEQDLLGDKAATTSILQKCIILGGRAGSTALRDWAKRELDGYTKDSEIPQYRRIHAQICLDGQAGNGLIRGQSIGPEDLPDVARESGIGNELPLPQGVGELEALARSDSDQRSIRISLPSSSLLVKLMNANAEPWNQVHEVYWKVQRETLQGVVDRVRTAAAELVGELLHTMSSDQGTPSKEQADQAVHFAITGDRAKVTFNNAQASAGSTITAAATEPEKESWFKRWRKRGIIASLIAAAGATAGVLNYLNYMPWS